MNVEAGTASGARVQDPGAFGKVAVLYGGRSAEREVSLESGRMVLEALQGAGVDAHGMDTDPQVVERLRAGGFDRVFIVLHGRGGEDGTLQSLDTAGIPYTGSGVLGSALAMDKRRTKRVWQSSGVPTPPALDITARADLDRCAEELGYPFIVKPVHEGSSIGMTKVTGAADLDRAWETATGFDDEVIAERWIEGSEYTVGILGGEALPPIRLETPRVFYDYEAKYADGAGTRYICPCGLAPEAEAEVRRRSLAAFDATGASGWGRVDLMRDADGALWFIEVNTVPGMTSHSLVPMAARVHGLDMEALVWRILEGTLA